MWNVFVLIFLGNILISTCDSQMGPDPWDYESNIVTVINEENIPPDLKNTPPRKLQTNNIGSGEWFYKRMLAIVLKSGQVKNNEDGSIDIALQMKYSPEKWSILEEYIKSNAPFSEDMFRRSMGYIEESIYKPTITQRIVMAWSEYIQFYLIEYKMYITWTTSLIAGITTIFWLWRHISHKQVIILVILGLYIYEAFISYKEAEQQELEKFIKAVNTCKWYIWTSDCEVPPPNPLLFLKHMNPLKIGIRMITTLLTEPMVSISETVNTIIHGATDGLWFPFDKIMHGFLTLIFNALLIFLIIMIVFNYILNIPFSLNFLGMINIGLRQRNRTMPNIINEPSQAQRLDNGDRISGENLSKFLDVYTKALNTIHSAQSSISERWQPNPKLAITSGPKLKKSASTGRLPNFSNNEGTQPKNTI